MLYLVPDTLRVALALIALSVTPAFGDRASAERDYLSGEQLWAQGKTSEARAMHERALAELSGPQRDRLPRLQLARIHARLGDLAAADALYDAIVAVDPADAEAALMQVEDHIAAKDWNGAQQRVSRFLTIAPKHQRARELLAWIEEARGDLASELVVREALAASERPQALHDYGRALERNGDWASALSAYRRAVRAGGSDLSLVRAVERLERRMSPELAATMTAASDPGAVSLGAQIGGAVPFGSSHHLAFRAWDERATHDGRVSSAGAASGALVLVGPNARIATGVELGLVEFTAADGATHTRTAPAAFASGSVALANGHLQLALDGQLGSLWHETPRAVLEGGRVDGATTHVFGAFLGNRVVTDTGVQVRRFRLDAMDASPSSSQVLAWAGADVAVWTDFANEAAGESLDNELVQPTYLADSVVLSYRHYEMWGDTSPMFAARLSLAERAQIDQVSVVARKALLRGRLAIEAHAAGGRDWARDLNLSSAGAALWLGTTSRSRLSVSFDVAKESTGALTGERRAGWMAYHVDL